MGDATHDKVMQDSRDSLGHPTHNKVMWKSPDKQGLRTRRTPWTCSNIYPQTRICLSYYFMSFTSSSDISRGLSPYHLSLVRVNLGLQLINLLGMKGVFQTLCQHSSLLGRFIQTLATLLSLCLLPSSHIPYPLCSWECIQLRYRNNKQQLQHQQHWTLS